MIILTKSSTLVPYIDDTPPEYETIYIDNRYNGLTPSFGTDTNRMYLVFSSCTFTFADLEYIGHGVRAIVVKDGKLHVKAPFNCKIKTNGYLN